jgi:hypothetical protein
VLILILSGKYCRLVAAATSLVLSFVSVAPLQHHSAGDGFEDRMQIRCRSRFQVLELVSEDRVDRYRYFARALVRVRSPHAAH